MPPTLTWRWGRVGSPPCKISNLELASCGQLVTSLSWALSAFLYYGGLPRSRTIQGSRYHRIRTQSGKNRARASIENCIWRKDLAMRNPDSMQKLARAAFIATSVLVIIAGAVWGIRLLTMHHNQTVTQSTNPANYAIGGFPMTGNLAPDFKLIDQFGHSVTLSSLRGHEVVLAFIDARCKTLCPLTAEIMYNAKKQLGSSTASRVALVAINANPVANSVAAVQAWSINHGMLHQWLFLTGTAQQLQSVYHQYGLYDQVTSDGQVTHDPAMYIIDANGRERLFFETFDSNTASDLSSEEIGLEAGMRQWLPQP